MITLLFDVLKQFRLSSSLYYDPYLDTQSKE